MRSSSLWGLGLIFSFLLCARTASASSPIVIGEIGWAGSDTSTADEWIELWNVSDTPMILDGYVLQGAGGANGIALHGNTILAHQAFVIANYADTDVKSTLALPPDVVTTTISLSNSVMAIALLDGSGTVIDRAGDGGAPFAGTTSPKKTSMVRSAPAQDGFLATSWISSNSIYGFDAGAQEIGTPHWCDQCATPSSTNVITPTTTEITTSTPETQAPSAPDPVPPAELATTSTLPSATSSVEGVDQNNLTPLESVSSTLITEATSTIIEPSSTTQNAPIPIDASSTEPLFTTTSSELLIATTSSVVVTESSSTLPMTASVPIATSSSTPVSIPPIIPLITTSSSGSSSSGTSIVKSSTTKSATPTKSVTTKVSVTTKSVTPSTQPSLTKPPQAPKPVIVEPTPVASEVSAPTPVKPIKKSSTKSTSSSKGARVTLLGTVATPPFWLASAFILQAQDGRGLMVNVGKTHTQPPMGAKIRVTGTLKQTNKGPELSIGTKDGWSIVDTHGVVVTSTAHLLEPTEDDSWRLVTIQGVVSRVRSKSLDIDTEDTSIGVRMRATVEYRTERIHMGDIVNITGILDTTGYEPILYPRIADDVQIVSVGTKTLAPTVPVGSNLPPWTPFGVAGATVALSEGWRRAQKIYEERKLRKLLVEKQQFFLE